MFYVICPNCDACCETLKDAIGDRRADLGNVRWCDQCGVGFDYEDEEVIRDPGPVAIIE